MTGPNPIGALFGGPPDPATHALLDALPGGVGIFTLDGTLVMANRAYRELAGAPVGAGAGDLLGSTPPEDRAEVVAFWSAFFTDDTPWAEREMRVRGPSGEEVWVAEQARKVFDDDGRPIGVVMSWVDVTATKRAERATADANRYFETLMARSSDFVTVLEADGSWRSSGASAARVLGYEPGFDPEGGVFSLIHPDDLPRALDGFARVLEGEDFVDAPLELRVRDVAGAWRRLELVAANLVDDPVVRGVVVNARDVTARREAEERLAASEARYRDLVEMMDEGLWVTDAQGSTTYVNPRMAAMLAMPPRAMVGTSVVDYLDAESLATLLEWRARWQDGRAERLDLRFRRSDGGRVWASLTATVVFFDGRPHSVIGVVSDITERKALEAEIEAARIRAEAVSAAKTAMLERIGREVRTPLGEILDALATLAPDDRRDRGVARAASAASHLVGLVADLLDVARIETGELGLTCEPVDVDATVDAALRATRLGAGRVVRTGDDGCAVLADERRLVQILANLLTNADEHAPVGSRITVDRRRSGDRTAITVRDLGPGVDPARADAVFEPFVSGPAGETSAGGVGLGLTVARGLAAAMGGTLEVDDRPVGGAFVVTLPAAPPPGPAGPPATRRVLYVEDDAMNVELVERILATRSDVTLRVERSVADGIAALVADPPDVVLLDLHLPDGTGRDLVAAAREDPRTVGVPIVVVTADATARTAAEVAGLGAGCLTKPFALTDLLAVVDDPAGWVARTRGVRRAAG